MTKKMNILIGSLFATCLVFGYLTYHHYATQLGLGGSNFCDVSATFNCDAAALSKYAEIGGLPIAVAGLSFSLIMLIVSIFARLGWMDDTPFLKVFFKTFFSAAALISLVMGAISIFELKVVCPFCLASYILSFINVYLAWTIFPPGGKFELSKITESYGVLIAVFAIPFLAWYISTTVQTNFGLGEIRKYIPERLSQWQGSPQQTFDLTLGISKGSTQPKATIVEFADFKCPHCRVASQSLKTFMKGRTDVQLVFKPFPLDGSCNPAITQKGDNSRCLMAAWTLCAEKVAHKGWDVHYWLFDRQEELFPVHDLKETFTKMSTELGLDYTTVNTCAESAETFEAIKKSSQEGVAAQVQGTPTIFVNGKKLSGGQFVDILKAAVDSNSKLE